MPGSIASADSHFGQQQVGERKVGPGMVEHILQPRPHSVDFSVVVVLIVDGRIVDGVKLVLIGLLGELSLQPIGVESHDVAVEKRIGVTVLVAAPVDAFGPELDREVGEALERADPPPVHRGGLEHRNGRAEAVQLVGGVETGHTRAYDDDGRVGTTLRRRHRIPVTGRAVGAAARAGRRSTRAAVISSATIAAPAGNDPHGTDRHGRRNDTDQRLGTHARV